MYANLLFWVIFLTRLTSITTGLSVFLILWSIVALVYFLIKINGEYWDHVKSFDEEIEDYSGVDRLISKIDEVVSKGEVLKEKKLVEKELRKRVTKKTKWASITIFSIFLAVIFCTVNTLLPSKEEVITYVVAQEVDRYNGTVTDSSLAPQALIGVTDNTVKSLSDIIESVRDLLENKAIKEATKLLED